MLYSSIPFCLTVDSRVLSQVKDLDDYYTLFTFSYPQKLLIGVKYYTVHMYSMPYYTYGSTANFVF